ncbi:MAG: glycosyltransferase [Desulfobacterales bacterium]|nr:glycosyltransferase [Desulfobacterales bacterium]
MKILNVNMSIDPVTGGGTAERTYQMSMAFAKLGIKSVLLTTNVGLKHQSIRNLKGIDIAALPCVNERYYIPKFSYRKIRKIIHRSDIVHLMNHWTYLNAIIYQMAVGMKKPYVVCPAGALPIYGRSKFIKQVFNFVIGKRIIRNANAHIAVSINEVSQYKKYGIASNQVVHIPNGINEEDFKVEGVSDFRNQYGLGGAPFILFLGRLNHIKGPDLLLQAFNNLKDKIQKYHLVFVGPDGGMLAELRKMTFTFGIDDRVHFIGYLGGIQKAQAYHAADLLAIPSRQEAMSIVVLEAGIAGTPALITDQCGFDEIERIGGGKAVSASVQALQLGLEEILRDSGRLKEMGEKLRIFVSGNYTWDVIINRYIDLYRCILQKK